MAGLISCATKMARRAYFGAVRFGVPLVLMGVAFWVVPGSAAPIQITGNMSLLPDEAGHLTLVDISVGTNANLISTHPFSQGITGLALHGRYAYASVTNEGLNTFDLSARPPTWLAGGRFITGGAGADLACASNFVFIADGTNGIAVIDVFDPTDPEELPSIATAGQVTSLVTVSNRLYAACGNEGLQIFSVGSSNQIAILGKRSTTTPARQVVVAGSQAFVVCDGGRLEIIQVQAPANPAFVSSYQAAGPLAGVAVAGNFAVVAQTNGVLTTLNLSNPTTPSVVGSIQIATGASSLQLVGKNAYVRNLNGNLVVVPIPALVATAPQLYEGVAATEGIVGQSAVMSVWAVGTTPLTYQWSKGGLPLTDNARVSGSTNAWLVISNTALTDAGVYSVNISNALGQIVSSNVLTVVAVGSPVLRGTFNPGGSAEGIDVAEEEAYVAVGTNGVRVYHVLNPHFPVGSSFGFVEGYASGVRAQGDYAYLSTGTNGLQVYFDGVVSTLTPATNTTRNTKGCYPTGGLIYLADGTNGLQVFRLNGTAAPTFLGGYDTPGFAWNVQVIDGVAYVADGTNGLQILSVTNPAAISFLAEYHTGGDARQVRVNNHRAFVAAGPNGLTILSVTNPVAPQWLGSSIATAPVLDVDVVGDVAALACGSNGLAVVDVSNPSNVLLRGISPLSPARALRLEGKFVYVAAGTNGVRIFELLGLQPDYPEIISSPLDTAVLPGTSVTFPVVVASAAPLAFQWYKDGRPLLNGQNVNGVVSNTLTVSNLQLSDSGEYQLKIQNDWNLFETVTVNLFVVPAGTPVLASGYFDGGDALNVQIVGQRAYVANRIHGLQVIDWSDPLNPFLLSEHPTLDLAQDVQVRGRYAYVASWGAGLEIFDALDPTHLVRVAACDTPGLAVQVQVVGSRAYVADRAGGICIIDIRNPQQPAILGRYLTLGPAEGVAVDHMHLFVAAAETGLQILDTSDPLAPTPLGQLDTPGHAESLSLAAQRAYVADYNYGLQIINVANPAAPTLLGSLETAGDAFEVQVRSNRAYLAEGIAKVSVVDISNPTTPALITTSLAGESVHGLHIVGKHALLSDRDSGLVLAELLGFAPTAPTILDLSQDGSDLTGSELVLSVADEGTPPLSYQWERNGVPVQNAASVSGADQPRLRFLSLEPAQAGDYTMVISNSQGVVTSSVVTVSAHQTGALLARGSYDTAGTAVAVAAYGNIGFVADGPNVLRLVDLTDLDHPTLVGTYAPTGSISGFCLQTNLLYLALGSNGVTILDITDPQQPKFAGAFDTPGTALRLDVTNGVAYVADGIAGLRIYNVSNPANVTALGFISAAGVANDVRTRGDFAYLAFGAAGVRIVNITNPSLPVVVGSYVEGGNALALQVQGNRLYLANGTGGFVILDITQPGAPTAIGAITTANAFAVALAGNLVVLVDGDDGCFTLDVSDPENIISVGDYSHDQLKGVTALGNVLLLPAGLSGLQIVEVAGLAPTPPRFLTSPTHQSVATGGTAQFEAWPADGTPPLFCRWYRNGLPVYDGARISGAATPKLRIANVGFNDAGEYQLRLFGRAGVTNSAAATLTFIGPLQAQINATPAGSVVELAPGKYVESLILDRDLTLRGKWWNRPVLGGGKAARPVQVLSGAHVVLEGIAIQDGFSAGPGGGILNEGDLRLDHCLVTDNVAASGAGIANLGTLTMLRSIVSNNVATLTGGGVFNAAGGQLAVTNSTLVLNSANLGGGVANFGTNTITQSLLAANLASGSSGLGGGIYVAGGLVTAINSTLSGNTAASLSGTINAGAGGGVAAQGGKLVMEFSTVANNSASGFGGGVSVVPGAEVRARNSLLADNFAPDGLDFGGTLVSDGYNLVQNPMGLTLTGSDIGNQLGVAALIGPLADNGGPTWTHAPEMASPVIDAGAAPGPATDARGVARPFEVAWADNLNSSFDIGAVEYLNRTPYLLVSNRVSTGFTLVWKPNEILQRSAAPVSGWNDLTNSSPLFVPTGSNSQAFFRLRALEVPMILQRSNSSPQGFQLSWPDYGILEHAPTPQGPWEAITAIGPYYVTNNPTQNEFFRVRVVSD